MYRCAVAEEAEEKGTEDYEASCLLDPHIMVTHFFDYTIMMRIPYIPYSLLDYIVVSIVDFSNKS
jgi:hypothetical protein